MFFSFPRFIGFFVVVSFGSGGDVGGGNCISDPEGRLVLEEGMQAGVFDFPRYGDITDEINST